MVSLFNSVLSSSIYKNSWTNHLPKPVSTPEVSEWHGSITLSYHDTLFIMNYLVSSFVVVVVAVKFHLCIILPL